MTRTKRKPPLLTDAERDDATRLIKDEYFNFLLSGPKAGEEGDAKLVGARHTTGKVVLAHLDQVWKSSGPGEDEAGDPDGGAHLGAARAGLAPFKGEEAETDDAGDG